VNVLVYRLEDLRTSEYAAPAERTPVCKERRRTGVVAVFNLHPIIDEVPTLLSERDALDFRNDNGSLAAAKSIEFYPTVSLPVSLYARMFRSRHLFSWGRYQTVSNVQAAIHDSLPYAGTSFYHLSNQVSDAA
jgi:hypothetical protein